jgi:hypothetical protein
LGTVSSICSLNSSKAALESQMNRLSASSAWQYRSLCAKVVMKASNGGGGDGKGTALNNATVDIYAKLIHLQFKVFEWQC